MLEKIIIDIVLILIYLLFLKKDIHIFQLEDYKPKNLFKWIKRNKQRYIQYLLIGIIAIIILIININTINSSILNYVVALVLAIILGKDGYNRNKIPAKKELNFTSRIKRLIAINLILLIIEVVILSMLNTNIYIIILMALIGILSIINLLSAHIILIPIQRMINNYYINDAKKILKKRNDLIVIGITGSYGKTSTKFILETILNEKYNVLATPNSYNTTLGNVRTIRENLKDEHQVFISEMGARNIGDIKEICDIVKPKYGIITSIGKQHLETFKNIENIIKTKYELIESLPQDDGVAFFNADNEYTYDLYLKETRKKYLYGIHNIFSNLDLKIKDIKVSKEGSTFILYSKNSSIECRTELLGQHNALNILGCASIALELGLSLEQIKEGISKLKPVEHRLQLIRNPNGTLVLDDAFNSNPNGAKMALDVLASFTGRKIIVTPGMIELGDEEYILNKEFGKNISKVVDIAILVGIIRTKAIFDGLVEEGYNKDNIYVVKNLIEATNVIGKIVRQGDTILFENDLPDNYEE